MTPAKQILIAVASTLLLTAITAALLFGSAGRLDVPIFWAALAVWAVQCLAITLGIDPDLLRERLRPGPGGRDRLGVFVMQLALFAHLLLAGLDVGRYHWSAIPLPAQIIALTINALAAVVLARAMFANRFFSPVVRLQSERGHHLIETGPYRVVRHPGYAAALVQALTSPVALGSWWSLVPMLLFTAIILRRTILEDRFLHDHLEGFPTYARRVRWRLIPSIW